MQNIRRSRNQLEIRRQDDINLPEWFNKKEQLPFGKPLGKHPFFFQTDS